MWWTSGPTPLGNLDFYSFIDPVQRGWRVAQEVNEQYAKLQGCVKDGRAYYYDHTLKQKYILVVWHEGQATPEDM